MPGFKRKIVKIIKDRINEPRRFIQIVAGPRQTGKTTAVTQALSGINLPYLFVEAARGESNSDWLKAQWYRARNLAPKNTPRLLVVDEVQYIPGWSAAVKTLWDEDSRNAIDLRVVLTGSSAALIQAGLGESLMGRFEIIESTHWFFNECEEAFGISLDDYLYFGAYPGAIPLIGDERRWLKYIRDSIIEPSIANDVLLLSDVRKPELMRRLFEVGAPYSAQEISYRKLLGQLDDRGNAATIAHYLTLLSTAGLMRGLNKYDPKFLREKASSPRIMVYNTALMSSMYGRRRKDLTDNPSSRGRLIESAVGAYLINRSIAEDFDVAWWREGDDEVDFVISQDKAVTAVEVKSGRAKPTSGMVKFQLKYPESKSIMVGSPECGLEEFLRGEVELFSQ